MPANYFDQFDAAPAAPGAQAAAPPANYFDQFDTDSAAITPAPPAVGDIAWSDYPKAFASGAVSAAASSLRGVGETFREGGALVAGGINALTGSDLRAVNPLAGPADALEQVGDGIRGAISPSGQAAMQGSMPTGNILPWEDIGFGQLPTAGGLSLNALSVFGQIAPIVAAAVVTRGMSLRGQLGASTATAGIIGGGAASGEEGNRIRAMDAQALAAVPLYAELVTAGADPAQAQEDTALAAESGAFRATAPVSAISGLLFGGVLSKPGQVALGRLLGQSRAARVAGGVAIEAPLEGTQEVGELAAQRAGAGAATGETRDLGEGSFGDFTMGAIGGAGPAALGGLTRLDGKATAKPPGPPRNIPAETLIGREPDPAAPIDLLAPGAGPRPPPGAGGLFGEGGLEDSAAPPSTPAASAGLGTGLNDGVTPVDLFNVGGPEPRDPPGGTQPIAGLQTQPTPGPRVEIGMPQVAGLGATPNIPTAAPNMPTAPSAPAGLTDFETLDFTAAAPVMPDTSYVDWQAPRPAMPTGNVAQSPESQATPDLSSSGAGNYKPGKLDSNVQLPKPTDIEAAANQAATSPVNDLPQPSDAQQDAGNYTKGHVKLHGLDISIEHPRGSTRSGTSKAGKRWETPVAHHYGYLRRTEGKDGEQVDVYLGPAAENPELPVFVVDQIDPGTRRFDEHKVMVGFADEQAARDGYRANYAADWDGIGGVQAMTLGEFRRGSKTGISASARPSRIGKRR